MKYYKVKNDVYDHKSGYTAIADELVTETERKKRFSTISLKAFEVVEIPKNNTFMIFGVRKQCR